jgi:hypothetical protein
MRNKQKGFSLVEGLLIFVIVGILASTCWYVWSSNKKTNDLLNKAENTKLSNPKKVSKVNNTAKPTMDPYKDWKTGTSTRANFTFKYPSDWMYANGVGEKDGVENIELRSKKFVLRMISFDSMELPGGGARDSKCSDCESVAKTDPITIGKLGKINLETIIYKLDDGHGNAIILRNSDGTYYISSPSANNKYTTFRGISVQDSLESYQKETPQQFNANSDLETAKLILKSVSY